MHVSFSAACAGVSLCFASSLASAQDSAPTGAIQVPAGCTSTTQPGGQVVITCPTAPSAPVQAPARPGPPLAPASAPIPPAPVYVAQAATTRSWYGWQTLIVDGSVVVATVAITPVSAEGAAATLLLGHTLGGPIVHWSNGQIGKGFASLGLRVGAPLGGALIGAGLGAAAGGCDDDCTAAVVGAGFGVVLGYLASIVVDSAVLAHKTVPAPQRAATPKLRWTPLGGYDPKLRTMNVGLGGTF